MSMKKKLANFIYDTKFAIMNKIFPPKYLVTLEESVMHNNIYIAWVIEKYWNGDNCGISEWSGTDYEWVKSQYDRLSSLDPKTLKAVFEKMQMS